MDSAAVRSAIDHMLDSPWPLLTFGLASMGGLYLLRKQAICWFSDTLLSLRGHPGEHFLAGNYAPVLKEVHETSLVVEGAIPAGLEGAYLRTGPNPMLPAAGGYHWFDGDGMVHGVLFSGGKAVSYANHSIRTSRLRQELAAGKALFLKAGDMCGPWALLFIFLDFLKKLLGATDKSDGDGTANISVVFHGRRIMALHEGDMPIQLRMLEDGSIETLGRVKLVGGDDGKAAGGKAQPRYPGPFTAHPKVDPVTGEMFFFGYVVDPKPYVRAGILDAQGELAKQWKIDTPYPALMHDCGLTANYGVLLHMPVAFDIKHMLTTTDLPFVFKPELPTRVGLLRRDTPSCPMDVSSLKAPAAPVQWFDVPTGYILHVANCWEDAAGCVHVVSCLFETLDFEDLKTSPTEPTPEHKKQKLTEYVLDPTTGKTVSVTQLSSVQTDYPAVNPSKACHAACYVWGATYPPISQGGADMAGIAKFDLSLPAGSKDACVAQITYDSQCRGGEAVFVPRPTTGAGGKKAADEDDGWLLVFVHDPATNASSLNVYDARTMSNTPLARVLLPQRVPFGLHGTFVTAQQLATQRTSL